MGAKTLFSRFYSQNSLTTAMRETPWFNTITDQKKNRRSQYVIIFTKSFLNLPNKKKICTSIESQQNGTNTLASLGNGMNNVVLFPGWNKHCYLLTTYLPVLWEHISSPKPINERKKNNDLPCDNILTSVEDVKKIQFMHSVNLREILIWKLQRPNYLCGFEDVWLASSYNGDV